MSKATGTRVLLVPVAALAILLGGCGGGSDPGATNSSSSSTTAAATAGQVGGKSSSAGNDSSVSSGQKPDGSSTLKSPQGKQANANANGAGKQGPHIKQPKGPQEPAPTPKELAEATVVSMSLESPVLQPGPESVSTLPAPYTCNGKDTWPTLRWSGIPAGTAELALLVLNLEPVNEAFFFDWAVTGLAPSLKGLDSGNLPKGAIVGQNSFGKSGYSICPPNGQETYIFALYALPSPIPVRKGFDPTALRKQILEVSGNSGLMAVSYG